MILRAGLRRNIVLRHCGRSEAIQVGAPDPDCFFAVAPRNDERIRADDVTMRKSKLRNSRNLVGMLWTAKCIKRARQSFARSAGLIGCHGLVAMAPYCGGKGRELSTCRARQRCDFRSLLQLAAPRERKHDKAAAAVVVGRPAATWEAGRNPPKVRPCSWSCPALSDTPRRGCNSFAPLQANP